MAPEFVFLLVITIFSFFPFISFNVFSSGLKTLKDIKGKKQRGAGERGRETEKREVQRVRGGARPMKRKESGALSNGTSEQRLPGPGERREVYRENRSLDDLNITLFYYSYL